MAKNYVQAGTTLAITATAAVKSGSLRAWRASAFIRHVYDRGVDDSGRCGADAGTKTQNVRNEADR